MKKVLFILGFILAVLFSYGQNIDMRSIVKEIEESKTPKNGIQFPVLSIPIYELFGSSNDTKENIVHEILPTISEESGDIWFYPETFAYSDSRNGEFKQGWIGKSTVKRLEIIDVKMNIGIAKVNRIYQGEDVLENRIVSHYILIFHFNDGTSFQLGDKTTPVNIISNSEIHVPYPDIVPGSRYLMKSAVDDNANFGTGENFSLDELKLHYD